jgi:hypothetical protein
MKAMSSYSLRCACPGGRNGFRVFVQQVVHDRQIVRRKVPDHVAIVLKKSQVDARRIVVVELAERPFLEQFLDLADRAGKQERVIHHDLEVLLFRQADQFFRLLATLLVNGFSTNTCLPCSSAALVSS